MYFFFYDNVTYANNASKSSFLIFFKYRQSSAFFFAGWTIQIIHHFLKWVYDFLSVHWLVHQIEFVLLWWAHKLSQIKKKKIINSRRHDATVADSSIYPPSNHSIPPIRLSIYHSSVRTRVRPPIDRSIRPPVLPSVHRFDTKSLSHPLSH